MKKAFTSWIYYVIGGALFLLASLIAIVPDIVDNFVPTMEEWKSEYIFLFIGIIYLLVGFVWQDLFKAKIRHSTKNWDGPLSTDIVDRAWARCTAFYIASVLSILAGIVFTFAII